MKNKVVIIGLGLIGGSIARGLARSGFCNTLAAVDANEQVLAQARAAGVIDVGSTDLELCLDADMIVLAVPGLSIAGILGQLAGRIADTTVITDVASVKHSTIAAARQAFGEVPPNLVPGHPIAGSEQSGFGAAQQDLFIGKKVILTPLSQTCAQAIKDVTALWQILGAEILTMDVEHHDDVLAATSHLPHLLAFALVDTLSQQGEREEIFRYAAGGFRDFTRIASSDPVMWRDVFVANSGATLKILDKYMADLQRFKQALQEKDGDYFLTTFKRAKKSRDRFMQVQTSPAMAEAHDMVYIVEPGGRLEGEFRVPGDKSISHRAIILGSLARGVTSIEGFLEGEDALATLKAFRDMGVNIEGPEKGKVTIQGVGLHGLRQAPGPLYLGNSGTSMRLLAGLMAAQSFPSILTGDQSLSKRPMQRVAVPLAEMGADIRLQEGGLAPIELHPAQLHPINYDMPVASAQVKSCLLLASLYVDGETRITEPAPCRDHTERMLRGFSWPVHSEGNTVRISGGASLEACHIDVPSDISSAAFFLVGASICPGADIVLQHVGINPTRIGVINILRAMGADITLSRQREVGGEPVADIRVRHAALQGIEIPRDQVPLAIDEFPALFIAAACASGTTVLSGAEELRVKESDRIQVMADGLVELGIALEVKPDGIVIQGGQFQGGTVDSEGDHRIAMAFVMASLRANGSIRILDCNNVATSFPGFAELSARAGIKLQVSHDSDR
ncbi:MAG: bifunctional prephenate dehydrogenase/3-phosphoshikimate 1-carboxyvinyltransferase [Pseudohongiellaceae bacterium]